LKVTVKKQPLGKKESVQSKKQTWFNNTTQFQKDKLYSRKHLLKCCMKKKAQKYSVLLIALKVL